jgi:hypothetical protein
MCRSVAFVALLLLSSCATDRYRWSITHAYFSPAARKLPRPELEQIVDLVSHRWSDSIIAVGQACGDKPDEMHVVARYTDYRVMVFDLKKIAGDWKIMDSGEGSPTLSTVWYGC